MTSVAKMHENSAPENSAPGKLSVLLPPCHISTPAETLTLERTSGGQAVAVFAFLADRLVFLAGLAW